MRLTRISLAVAATASLMAMTSVTYAFSDSEARQAILELRQELRTLTETSQRASLQLANRIDMLEQEITRLRAQIEELGGPRVGSSSGAGQQPEQAQDSKEQAAFDGAMDLYRKGEFKGAAESLSAFITLYPESVLTPTAQFYLGSTNYANKNYKGAISVLNTMAGKFPDHPRAPDALLVVAGSQFELNQRSAAKATLQKIVKDYPDTAAAQSAQERLKLL
ncbi:MAG: tol-pal system protein YbgF [Burkholderiaceae bacterium]|nr:tol-pal system protein YbgF [Burkholderiaceae bacterium]MCD8517307.1 tol-pal system protein YbgF [Burkholderiaceae bacterium]MCD8537608.1 tol-pal system protein YbgF [Burkholderiaceae bacterium]MCD8566006.1 tol-pal system protein YbgF [Burkholderiaceae bacterium]